jgi:hypothetical protein
MTLTIEVDLPSDLNRLRLPAAVEARLQSLFDRQDERRRNGGGPDIVPPSPENRAVS